MKNNKYPIFVLLLITISIFSCSSDDENLSKENNISTNYDFTINSSNSVLDPFFPTLNEFRTLDKNSTEVLTLKSEILSIDDYNLDFSSIEKLYFEEYDFDFYSIAIFNSEKKVLVTKREDYLTINYISEKNLSNGNKEYSVSNYKDELMFKLEQNRENKFGNVVIISDVDHGSFQIGNASDPEITTNGGSCLYKTDFSDCMQCAWDECSSSWVCGAVLALKPLEVIASAAILCGANSLLSVH